jgi:hypothetical protein
MYLDDYGLKYWVLPFGKEFHSLEDLIDSYAHHQILPIGFRWHGNKHPLSKKASIYLEFDDHYISITIKHFYKTWPEEWPSGLVAHLKKEFSITATIDKLILSKRCA